MPVLSICLRKKIRLSFGLSLEAVRSLLAGWKDHPARATESADRAKLYAVWDFTPPQGSDAPPLRLTFENEKLILWGQPSTSR